MTPTRRRTLRALGATVAGTALAGCLSDDGSTDDPSGDNGDSGVILEDVTATPAVVTLDSPDSYGTYGDRNEQLIIADLSVESPGDHPVSSFAVEAGGERYEATTDIYGGFELETFAEPYEPAEGPTPSASASEDGESGPASGWIAAYVPKPLDADSATLTWDGGEYTVADTVLERLNRPPASFDVAFEAPETATVGEDVTATVTVENTADVQGTFVGAINRVGPRIAYAPEAEVRLDIEAGETAEWEYIHSLDSSELAEMEDPPSMDIHLVWRDDSTVRTVDIESE